MKKTFSILCGIVIFSLLLRLYFFYSFNLLETNETDALTRLAQANSWSQSGNLISIPSMAWPSGHQYLLGLPLLLGFDPILGGQALTILLSLLSLFLYFYVLRAFFDKSTSLASTFLFAVLPIGVQLSVLTLSEIPFCFFILLSFAFLLKAREILPRQSVFCLILSSLACLCATWIRFEAWPFALLIFPLFLYVETRNLKNTLLLFLGNFLGPAIYMFFSYKSSSTLIYGLSFTNKFVRLYEESSLLSALKVYQLLIRDFTFAFLFGFIFILPWGIKKIIKDKVVFFYFLIFVAWALYLIFETMTHALAFYSRYYFFPTLMLAPFIFYAFPSKMRPWGTGLICSLIFLQGVFLLPEKIKASTDYELRDSGVFQMAKWVEKNISQDEKMIYDGGHWAGASFLLASKRLEKNTVIVANLLIKHPEATSPEAFFQLIRRQFEVNQKMKYIVYSQKPSLEKIGFFYNKAIWEKFKNFYQIKELAHYGDFSLVAISSNHE